MKIKRGPAPTPRAVRKSCFELLRDAGANLEATATDGFTPLHYAAINGNARLLSMLGVIDGVPTTGHVLGAVAVRQGQERLVAVVAVFRRGRGAQVDDDAVSRREAVLLSNTVVERPCYIP